MLYQKFTQHHNGISCGCIYYSVTKGQQHVYDYVATKPLATRVYDRPVKKLSSADNDIEMDVNPAYGEGTFFANKTNKANDAQYEVVDAQLRQMNIKMDTNPAYAETKFT